MFVYLFVCMLYAVTVHAEADADSRLSLLFKTCFSSEDVLVIFVVIYCGLILLLVQETSL